MDTSRTHVFATRLNRGKTNVYRYYMYNSE